MASSGYSSKQVIKGYPTSAGAVPSIDVGANASGQVLTGTFRVGIDQAAKGLVVGILVSTSTVGTGMTAKLQHRISRDAAWLDSKTVAITTGASNTMFYIKLLDTVAGDQAYMPIMPECQVVVSSGAGDSATITGIWATCESV